MTMYHQYFCMKDCSCGGSGAVAFPSGPTACCCFLSPPCVSYDYLLNSGCAPEIIFESSALPTNCLNCRSCIRRFFRGLRSREARCLMSRVSMCMLTRRSPSRFVEKLSVSLSPLYMA